MAVSDIVKGAAGGLTGGLVSAGAGLIGGALGRLMSRGDRKKAQAAVEKAAAIADSIGASPDEAKALVLEQFKSAGIYSPEIEQAVNQEVSKVAEISEDPELKDAQMNALGSLQRQGRTGISATDRAALNQIRGEVQRDTEAKRQQILQQMQMRGQGGSGAELAAQLQASQGGSDQASAQGDRLAAMAQERALQAIGQAGSLGGQIRGQDFDVARTKATAQDEMNRFNTQNAVNRQMRNTGSRNEAQQSNLQQQQAIMNANVQMANAEKQRQSEAARQKWMDDLNRAQFQSGAAQQQANVYSNKAAQNAQAGVNIGSGAAAGFGALSGYLNNKPADKTASPAPASVSGPGQYEFGTDDEVEKRILASKRGQEIA